MWVNSQHLMSRLARANRVLYVNNTGLRLPGASSADLEKIAKRLRLFVRGPRMVQDNLWVLSPIIVPYYKSAAVRRLNTRFLSWHVRRCLRSYGMDNPVLWVFLPTGVDLVGRLGESAVIYHCVDEYSRNPGVPTSEIQAMDRDLCRRADVVFTTSRGLFEEKRPLNERTRYVPNVANADHFAKALEDGRKTPADLAAIPRPVIGYAGNIASYKVDLPLLEKVATARPDWSFVLVGPVGWGDPNTNVKPLQALANVHFLDRKTYDELPAYVRGFDVCLIPFVKSPVTDSCFPMKFFE
jgi:hypothetical protein